MEEAIKTRIILILGIFCVILLLFTVKSCSSAFQEKTARDKEMALRMEFEEKLKETSQGREALDTKLQAIEKQLEEEKTAHEATKKALVQEQLVNQSLKDELLKETKLKETLEEKLKEALVADKSKSKK